MKLFLNTIFCEYYSWYQNYWGRERQMYGAVYLIALLIFLNLFSFYMLLNAFFPHFTPTILSNTGLIIYFLIIILINIFLFIYFRKSRPASWCKDHAANKLLGLTKKQLAGWYLILTILIFFLSAYILYLVS